MGPVTFFHSVQLSLNAPNALIQETVRAYNATWYLDVVTDLPWIEGGFVYAPEGPGAGAELNQEFLTSPETTSRVSEL